MRHERAPSVASPRAERPDREPATAGDEGVDPEGVELARVGVLVVGILGPLASALKTRLRASGYQFAFVRDGHAAVEYLRGRSPNLAVVHHHLPDVEARRFCMHLRKISPGVGLVVVAPGASAADTARWLDLGIDDCVAAAAADVVPELMARIRRALRARGRDVDLPVPAELRFGPLRLETDSRLAWVGADVLPLSRLEFQILQCLVRRAGRSTSVAELLMEAWAETRDGTEVPRKVRVAVSRVRRALARVTGEVTIERSPGEFYRLA